MQSSVRSETPRLFSINSKTPSMASLPRNGSVQVNEEISVVTSRAKSPTKRASYSPIPPIVIGNDRGQSNGTIGTISTSAPQVKRWNSVSRISDRSFRHQPRLSLSHQDSKDPVLLDSNRESMKALADFLMTKEPPPNNWVSIPSDDERSLRSLKKSAFRMFARQKKKKKPRASKLLQLPDSAVAAKTLEGARHIAISIPLEHDHMDSSPAQFLSPCRPRSAPKQLSSESPVKGAVTVLKPVVEVQESTSSHPPRRTGDEDPNRQSQGESITAAADILGPENIRTLENYYTQLNNQQRRSKAEGKRAELTKSQRSYVAISPVETMRGDSQRSDPRHSGGTAYSTTSMSGHSRGASSVSTAPSVMAMSGLRLDLPPRKSSKPNAPLSLEAELADGSVDGSAKDANEQARKEAMNTRAPSVKSGKESMTSGLSQSPQAIFATKTLESAHGYNAPGVQLIRTHTLTPSGSAPTKKLPDLPWGAPISRPSTAEPKKSKSTSNVHAKRSSSVRDSTDQLVQAAPQSRQERVKARKQRDIAALRNKGDAKAPLSESNINGAASQATTIPPRSSRRRSASQELVLKRTFNTISPIMLVASLQPYTGLVLTSDLPSPSSNTVLRKTISSNSNTVRTHTPPHSVASSFGSDSDTIPRTRSAELRNRGSVVGSPNRSLRNTVLETRRQERRAKRNMTLHEKEIDARLTKIERDNAMLLNTLGGIAASFGEFNKLFPRGALQAGRQPGESTQSVDTNQELEPVIRDIKGGAGLFNRKSLKRVPNRDEGDELEEDDESSII